ncbi:MAG: cell surface protein, partial [Ottowia sp.]|nr:cell surface protein [Ottowia sp.]
MKKSILALGAAAALGGLGFAGSAHALAYFGPGTTAPTASTLELNPGGIGHYLFTPYFSAQGTIGSMWSITNTDATNGKAVKVRFRSASNSDDVLDFTVFLSPLDVWTAGISQAADGTALITTTDKSCTLPVFPAAGVSFKTNRLPSLSADQMASLTREGYVEMLNMADIPPGSALYTAIKHVGGVAPCSAAAFAPLQTTTVVTAASAEAAGLAAPTGLLMGSWAVMNQAELAVYGGAQTAVQAVVTSSTATAAGLSGSGLIAYAPQLGAAAPQATVDAATADPLLRSQSGPKISPLWFDLPDMSTPLVPGNNPLSQADLLSAVLAKASIVNDYAAAGDGAAVPMETDWVVSQPTRRYHAAMDYTTSKVTFNNDMTNATSTVVTTSPTNNRYGALVSTTTSMGPMACLTGTLGAADREETTPAGLGADFSPGTITTAQFCGEVFTLSFARDTSMVMQAQVANTGTGALPGVVGWARLGLDSGGRGPLPIVGFAATSIKNANSRGNFGLTLPHRW